MSLCGQQTDTAETTLVEMNSLELVPLKEESGSEMKKQTIPACLPETLCSKGETEDVKMSFFNFSFV